MKRKRREKSFEEDSRLKGSKEERREGVECV